VFLETLSTCIDGSGYKLSNYPTSVGWKLKAGRQEQVVQGVPGLQSFWTHSVEGAPAGWLEDFQRSDVLKYVMFGKLLRKNFWRQFCPLLQYWNLGSSSTEHYGGWAKFCPTKLLMSLVKSASLTFLTVYDRYRETVSWQVCVVYLTMMREWWFLCCCLLCTCEINIVTFFYL